MQDTVFVPGEYTSDYGRHNPAIQSCKLKAKYFQRGGVSKAWSEAGGRDLPSRGVHSDLSIARLKRVLFALPTVNDG